MASSSHSSSTRPSPVSGTSTRCRRSTTSCGERRPDEEGNPMKFYDAEAVRAGLTPAFADAALEEALTHGLDVEADSPRLFSGLSNGEFLLMPAGVPALGGLPAAAGVKVLTLAPDNPAAGLPRIQGTYLLF